MIKNFWWPLEFSERVTKKPVRVTALGQEFVLYRQPNGEAVVMSDLCVHRGGALSDGWLEGNCIVCPYHGWRYQPDGACDLIPANHEGVPVPKKARVDAYPSQEKLGWVWAFLGDLPEAERPSFPNLLNFDPTGYKMLSGEFHWNAHYERVLENSIDIAHAPFVHSDTFGNREEPEVQDYTIEYPDEWSGVATVYLKPPARKGLRKLLAGNKPRPIPRTRTAFFMPCITMLNVDLPIGNFYLFNVNLPIDDYHTVTKWIQYRSFFKANWADYTSRKSVLKIFNQDKPIVEAQRPELLPFDIGAELHVKSDSVQIAYRKTRQKALAKGWAIDMHRIQAEYSRHQAVVIPSPARRDNPELANAWVLKEVPTHHGEEK